MKVMKRNKFKISTMLATVAILALAQPTMAMPQDFEYTISTAKSSGSYARVGHNLVGIIGGQGRVIKSKGGWQNLERLLAGEADVIFAQADSYAKFVNKFPEAQHVFEVMGPMYEECAKIAVAVDGRVTDEDHLQDEGAGNKIGVGSKGSGGVDTWDYMSELEKKYQFTSFVNVGGARALSKLLTAKKVGSNALDAVLWVSRSEGKDEMMDIVNKNPKLKMISVDDGDLTDDYPPLGRPIYRFKKMDVEKGFWNDTEVKTACMDSMMIARSDADEDFLDELANSLLKYKSNLLDFN